jgi:hypothetical protein
MGMPDAVIAALGPDAEGARHVPLRSGIGTLLGESHLVFTNARLRVFSRTSVLDPLVELEGVVGARIVSTTLRPELVLEHAAGSGTIGLGFGEEEPTKALLEALPSAASGEAAAPPVDAPKTEPSSSVPAVAEPTPPLRATELSTRVESSPAVASLDAVRVAESHSSIPGDSPNTIAAESTSGATLSPSAPTDERAASRAEAPALRDERAKFVALLEARRESVEERTRRGWFTRYLAMEPSKRQTRALHDASAAMSRRGRDAAIEHLRNYDGTDEEVVLLALGELLLEAGRGKEAVDTLLGAIDAGADEAEAAPLLERAARFAGNDKMLVEALELEKEYAKTRIERRAIDAETRQIREKIAKANAAAQSLHDEMQRASARGTTKSSKQATAPGEGSSRREAKAARRAEPTAPSEEASLTVSKEEREPKAKRSRKAAATDTATDAATEPSTSSSLGKAESPQGGSILPWLVLIALLLTGVGSALSKLLAQP